MDTVSYESDVRPVQTSVQSQRSHRPTVPKVTPLGAARRRPRSRSSNAVPFPSTLQSRSSGVRRRVPSVTGTPHSFGTGPGVRSRTVGRRKRRGGVGAGGVRHAAPDARLGVRSCRMGPWPWPRIEGPAVLRRVDPSIINDGLHHGLYLL